MEKVSNRFNEQLDIRSLVKVRTNLALLLRLLLTDKQLLLFRHQRRRSIGVASDDEQSSSSMNASSDDIGTPKSSSDMFSQWSKLLGFRAESRLDRLLLGGLFDMDIPRSKGESDGDRTTPRNKSLKKILSNRYSQANSVSS